MDKFSCRVANRLVGNPDDAATLEITLTGPELYFEGESVICIAGADFDPTINQLRVPIWTCVLVKSGSTLAFGERRSGARSYLAIAGGINVPLVMKSRSTHTSSQTGGLDGRPLIKDDTFSCGSAYSRTKIAIGKSLPDEMRPVYQDCATLRIVPGPQAKYFLDRTSSILTSGKYKISHQSDRMGYRLVGPRLPHAGSADIISDCTAMGALQVPADEQPILLMADRQTTGGYPKIAVVISADLSSAAQLMPGHTIEFRKTSVAASYALYKKQRQELDEILPPSHRSAAVQF